MKTFDVITCGEPLVLFSPDASGPLRHVPVFHKYVAGAELNFSVAMARLGLNSGLITKVGQDEFGRYILAAMQAEGLDTSLVKLDDNYPTGIYFKEYSGLTDPKVYYYRKGSAASNLSIDDIDPKCLDGVRLLHLTGITPALSDSCFEAYLRLLYLAAERRVPVSFDPNIRLKLIPAEKVRKFMEPFISRANLLILNENELNLLYGTRELAEALPEIWAAGVELVVQKRGAEGAVAARRTEKALISSPPFKPTRYVDPVGAGDGFDAGFVYGYLQGWSIQKCLRLGNLVGALATTVKGDFEGYPFWPDAQPILEKEVE